MWDVYVRTVACVFVSVVECEYGSLNVSRYLKRGNEQEEKYFPCHYSLASMSVTPRTIILLSMAIKRREKESLFYYFIFSQNQS